MLMRSSDNPFLQLPEETTKHILSFLSLQELQTASHTHKNANEFIEQECLSLIPIRKLIDKFNIAYDTAHSLSSPDLVYQRLCKIMKSKNHSDVLCEGNTQLYQLYCASGIINDDFVHLLDNQQTWFKHYFAG